MQLMTQPRGLLCLVFALALVHLGGGIDSAAAYPQFQLSTYNNRCNICHYAPAGGGLINGFGRDESSQTISSNGGDGGFLHGLWQPPEWFQLGLDLRGALAIKELAREEATQVLGFPMQGDLYTRLAVGGVSFNVILGLQGAARPTERSFLSRLISREHFVMWEQSEYYVRAGRFFAPYGLRLQDHTSYTRRYLDQHTFEETYNLSGGFVSDAWEVHATFFVPVPPVLLGVGNSGVGGAMYYERRFLDDTAAYGVQTKVSVDSADTEYWLGGVGKIFLEDQSLLFQAQLDIGLQTYTVRDVGPLTKVLAHLSGTYFWRQGWMFGAALERYSPDVLLASTGRDSFSITGQYFPYAHLEVMFVSKLEFQGEAYDAPNLLTLLMLHYYL